MGINMSTDISIHALRYEQHGLPAEVLEMASLDLPQLQPGEALVALRLGAIHYSDLGLINGTYGNLKKLPAIAGREGVGEVVALGLNTSNPKIGTLVRMPEEEGVWRDAVVAKVENLLAIPAGVPMEQAALAFINPPTAWRMLHDFVKLERGDWLIQNAGTSAVGVLIAQLAKHLGLNCISVVRDVAMAESLHQAGAVKVVAEDSGYEKNAAKLTGGAPIKLALNAVGGESVGRLCRAVARDGVVVTYGGVTAEPMRFPTRPLIFSNIQLRGFWLDGWVRSHPVADTQAMYEKVFELLRADVMAQPVAAKYPLTEWRAALERAFRAGKGGKLLFEGQFGTPHPPSLQG
jgi:mitochondrial enoyl-[acyl-carrier protein] reductase / trans-2-enoyl-CoA reductase